jgi:hypothetical protein
MLTDIIACTNSTDTYTGNGTVGTGSRHNSNNHKHSHSNSNKDRQSNSQNDSRNNSHNNSPNVQLSDEIGEELLLNAIAVCTNITFYACKVRTCLSNVLTRLAQPNLIVISILCHFNLFV